MAGGPGPGQDRDPSLYLVPQPFANQLGPSLCETCEILPVHAKGECRPCRVYRLRTGRPRPEHLIDRARERLANYDPTEVLARFAEKIERGYPSGCWIWSGRMGPNGYGYFDTGFRTELAHRFAYEIRDGEIPPGVVIEHTCEVSLCVNPDHLAAVSQSENLCRSV